MWSIIRVMRLALGCILATAVLTSCTHTRTVETSKGTTRSTDGDQTHGSSVDETESSNTSTTDVQPAERGVLGSGSAVTIAFAGDSSFQGLTAAVQADPTGVLSAIAPMLGDADLTMVNLESALGIAGAPEPKTFTFQTPAQTLEALRAAGVDVVTMANNHAMDFGETGLAESLRIKRDSPIAILGIGEDADEAISPFVTEVKGQRIAFLAANDVFDSSLEARWTATDSKPGVASSKGAHGQRLLDAVRSSAIEADTVVVYLHYGRETETCPTDRQRELVELLTDAGADIVVGSHAHRLQGIGYLGDRLIAYGLGNFIFHPGSAAGRETGVLVVTATGSRIDSFEWRPAVINDGLPIPLTGERAVAEMAKMERLRQCAGLSSSPDVTASSSANAE